MKGPSRRLLGAAGILVVAGLGVTLILLAFRENLLYFYYPAQLAGGAGSASGRDVRVGGLVAPGSLRRASGSLAVYFTLTDYESELEVRYEGILPALFQEGQGAIVTGRLRADGTFAAVRVLARHDENYVPPELSGLAGSRPGTSAGAWRRSPGDPPLSP